MAQFFVKNVFLGYLAYSWRLLPPLFPPPATPVRLANITITIITANRNKRDSSSQNIVQNISIMFRNVEITGTEIVERSRISSKIAVTLFVIFFILQLSGPRLKSGDVFIPLHEESIAYTNSGIPTVPMTNTICERLSNRFWSKNMEPHDLDF